MTFFKDNRLRVRYTMSFGLVALVMAISGLVSYRLITLQKSFTIEFSKKFNPAISAILNADRDLYQARVAELDVLIDPSSLDSSLETFEENAQQAFDRMHSYLDLLEKYPDVTNKVTGFDSAYEKWKSTSKQVFDLVRNGNLNEAEKVSRGASNSTFSSLRDFYDIAGEAADKKGLALGESTTKMVNDRQLFVATILSISILLAVVAGTIAPASMSRSLHHLRKELLRLNSGDGDLSKRIRSTRKDEIGQVANEVDALLDGLTDLIRNVAEQSGSVLAHVNEMGISTGKVNSNAKHQLESIEMIVTAVNEMAVAIKEVSENAQITATEIREVNSLTNSGKAITSESVDRIQEVSQGVRKAADVINELSKSSDKIASVLDVIRGIAEQTNLLALNAAIEAARAGEQGRGFAVVADEVRSLASKTQQSTDDIQIMIESLQKGVKDAVYAIDSGLETVKISVEKSQETLVALDSIVEAADRVANASTMIATSTEEQSHVAEDVNQNLTQLADLSQNAMEESDDNQERANQAASVTKTLSDSVTRFQLP